MRKVWPALICLVFTAPWAFAAPGTPPTGYTITNVSNLISSGSITGINQMIFKPGDPTTLYASRGFESKVTKYNYSSSGTLSGAVNIVDLAGQELDVITGIGFHNNDIWLTRWKGWDNPRPGAITRMQDGPGGTQDGIYESRVDYATGIELLGHTINQIQIVGNTLYTGIGMQRNDGNPTFNTGEREYNGTIARIVNLNSPVAVNLNNASERTEFMNYAGTDGKLRLYSKGYRNPYGIRIKNGVMWVSDNGADSQTTPPFNATPDFLYKNIQLNDRGNFPPPGYPGAPENPVSPFANFGTGTLSTAGATGFDFIPTGPDRGNAIVGMSSATRGRRLMMVNAKTGGVTEFLTGFSTPTDVIVDPYGQLLISDLDGNAVYRLRVPIDADVNFDRKVNITDLKAMAMNWGNTNASWAQGDYDRSGIIDVGDFNILAENWQENGLNGPLLVAAASLGLTVVPEPSTLAIALVGLVAISSRRSRSFLLRSR